MYCVDVNIVGGEKGLRHRYLRNGNPSGVVWIRVASEEDVVKACKYDKEIIPNTTRYLEGESHTGE